MKIIAGIMLVAGSMLFGAAGAHTPSSSFVPRGPEPHASLSDKHHAHRSAHGGKSTSSKAGHHGAAKARDGSKHHSANPH